MLACSSRSSWNSCRATRRHASAAFVLTFAALQRYYIAEDGSTLAEEAVALAEACGDLEALVQARSIAAIWLPTSEQLPYAEATVALCDGSVASEHVLRAYNTLAIAQCRHGQMKNYTKTATRGAELARRSGLAAAHGPNMVHYSILGNFWIGEWDRALETAARTTFRECAETSVVIAQIRLRRGDDIDRRALAESLDLQLETVEWDDFIGNWLELRLQLGLERTVDEVLEMTKHVFRRASSMVRIEFVDILDASLCRLADVVDALPLDQRDAERERALTGTAAWRNELARAVDPTASPTDQTYRRRISAECARLAGASDAGAWCEVADVFRRMGMPYDEAVARLRTAEAELAGVEGRTVAAHARASMHTTRAAELAGRLRARPLLEEIQRLRRAAHLDVGNGTPASHPGDSSGDVDTFGLSRREHEILTLVAEGKSNGEIGSELYISTKTASSHVSNILRKLGVANRTEAATAAQRHGLIAGR